MIICNCGSGRQPCALLLLVPSVATRSDAKQLSVHLRHALCEDIFNTTRKKCYKYEVTTDETQTALKACFIIRVQRRAWKICQYV